MQGRHPILVGLLLVAFATGGVIGPTVHLVRHGEAQRSGETEPSCHTADVHASDGPLWTDATDGRIVPECDLCATRLLLVPPAPIPATAPRVMGKPAVEVRSHAAVAAVASVWFIRGPPSPSGARLA
ncbi:MAG: hypothetical protein V5A20_12200 [Salinibacter sp.]|uniref:hypothetical protein n=1 Tax=Salinibacter sp. TaxID=2065818 RepID=UPI002FC294D8